MMGGSGQLVLCVDSDQLTLDTLYFYLATADFTVNCFSAISHMRFRRQSMTCSFSFWKSAMPIPISVVVILLMRVRYDRKTKAICL